MFLNVDRASFVMPSGLLHFLLLQPVALQIGIKIPVSNLCIKNEYAFPCDNSICVKKRIVTATISTLFYRRLWVWPIVMIVRTYGSCRKNIDNFVSWRRKGKLDKEIEAGNCCRKIYNLLVTFSS